MWAIKNNEKKKALCLGFKTIKAITDLENKHTLCTPNTRLIFPIYANLSKKKKLYKKIATNDNPDSVLSTT